MKVNRASLIECLEKVIPALGINVLVPEFQYLQFDKRIVQATDGALIINTTLPEGSDYGSFAVPGRPFYDLLRNLDKEEVDLIVEDNKLKVKTNKIEGTFIILDKVNLISVDTPDSLVLLEDFPNFIQGLNYCRFGVSKDETLGSLCGVKVKENLLLSSDRYRITKWNLNNSLSFKCSLPIKFIDILLKNKDEIQEMGYSKNNTFVVVLRDGTSIITAVLIGLYPDLLQYFPTSEYREIEFVDDQKDALEKHISFLKNVNLVDKEIDIKISKNKCVLTSRDKELGTLIEEVEISSSNSSEIEFSANPIFLKDIMEICSSFKYYVEAGLILFETDNLQYLAQVRK